MIQAWTVNVGSIKELPPELVQTNKMGMVALEDTLSGEPTLAISS